MVLNLFLALLLNSFNSEELKSRKDFEDEVKGEQTGSTKFFSNKLKQLKALHNRRKEKKSKEDADGNLESSGKKFSSNGSIASQANGVNKTGKDGSSLDLQLP